MAGPERFELPTAGFEDQNSSAELRTVISICMKKFAVKFKNCPILECQLDDTSLAERYYELLKQQYTDDPQPIFRDQQKYTIEYFKQLVVQAQEILGWNWYRHHYDVDTTIRLHKDIEEYLAKGFDSIPEEHDEILHELHFALHSIESGSKRDNWLQIEWYNDRGFDISPEEYPAKCQLVFGDLRLQNPFVGHHPLFLYEQQDSINVAQTCKFHNFCKPGINIVINDSDKTKFNKSKYVDWFITNASEFVTTHGIKKILQFTGHPIVGRVLNLNDLRIVVAMPVIEFEYLKF